MASAPPCRMLLRSKEGIELFSTPSKPSDSVEKPVDRSFLLKGSTTLQEFAPDGSAVFVHRPGVGIVLCPLDGSTGSTEAFLKDSKGVQMLCASPKGTYLLTWERLSSADPTQPNLKIWSSKTGDFLCGFVQRNLRKEGWPYVQWSPDEKTAFLLVTNEIRVYDTKQFGTEGEVRFHDKLRVPGVSSMSVPNTKDVPSLLVASFCSKTKDKPARASLHKYPANTPVASGATYPSIVSKSLFQAEEVTVHWSPKGDVALMALQTSVDTSGKSYYGSTTLHLMAEGSSEAVNVPLPTQGPVLDVAWMPNPDKPPCFAVISGRMPSMGSLHHGTSGEALFLFGNAHRNTISWAPHGRFVCLAGFGNLAGGMTFWDKNKSKPIPQYDAETGVPVFPELKASCTVGFGWSPDSRTFLSSTTSPRMNVDNGVKLFRYTGEELINLPWDNDNYKPDKLLQASFVPALPDVYPDRAQSPAPRITGDAEAIAAAKQRAKDAATKPAASTTKRYVPPSARGRTGGVSLAERMRREKEGKTVGATKVTPKPSVVGGAPAKKVPVGMGQSGEPQKSKNALRKERQKQNKAKRDEEERQKQEEAKKAEALAQAAAAADPEKRARKLKKTLKQIDDLKARDPGSLNDDQKKKIATEAELRAELEKLGV